MRNTIYAVAVLLVISTVWANKVQYQTPDVPEVVPVKSRLVWKSAVLPTDQIYDTLYYHDNTPYYYFGAAYRFRMARMTPIAPCSLISVLTAKYVKDTSYTHVAGCSLLVTRDTVIDGSHYPGEILYLGYYVDTIPNGYYAAVFAYDLSELNIRFGVEDFWVGWRYVCINEGDTMHQLSDAGASEPDRNAWASYSTGPWGYTPYDYLHWAVVKREEGVQVHDIEVLSVNNSQGFFLPNPGNATLSCVIHNNGTEPEQNFAVACTVYNDAGEDVYHAEYQVTTELLPDSVLEITFTPNWTPNLEGIYTIVVRSLLDGDARPANDVKMREAQVCGSVAELRYDNGTMENAWAFYNEGNGYANKFTLPYGPAKITAIKYAFWGTDWPNPGGTSFIARILADDGENGAPGTILYEDTITDAVRGEWNTYTLESPIIVEGGSFYVAYIQVGNYPNCLGMAVDEDQPYSYQGWTYYNGSWEEDPLTNGDWMIRAVIEQIPFYTLTVNVMPAGAGTVTKDPDFPEYPAGTWVKLTAQANPGYQFSSWSGDLTSTNNPDSIYMDGNKTVTANFISLIPVGWAQLESLPHPADLKEGKYVKDGGALVAAGNVLYAFPGNKSWQFFKYTPGSGWTVVESIPYGTKPNDPTRVNAKKVGKGAALCYDGSRYIYATKGNG
ncbi:MAG: hypothetical protein ABIK73_07580, partial [candidate division WOR-3 bacterium]